MKQVVESKHGVLTPAHEELIKRAQHHRDELWKELQGGYRNYNKMRQHLELYQHFQEAADVLAGYATLGDKP